MGTADLTRCATLFLKSLIYRGVGILPAQIRTGKMPIPQDFQIKLHIVLLRKIAIEMILAESRTTIKISNDKHE